MNKREVKGTKSLNYLVPTSIFRCPGVRFFLASAAFRLVISCASPQRERQGDVTAK